MRNSRWNNYLFNGFCAVAVLQGLDNLLSQKAQRSPCACRQPGAVQLTKSLPGADDKSMAVSVLEFLACHNGYRLKLTLHRALLQSFDGSDNTSLASMRARLS